MVIRMNRNPMGTCTYVAWMCGIRPFFGDSFYFMKRISSIRDRSTEMDVFHLVLSYSILLFSVLSLYLH